MIFFKIVLNDFIIVKCIKIYKKEYKNKNKYELGCSIFFVTMYDFGVHTTI
jgi:hypothetical protein